MMRRLLRSSAALLTLAVVSCGDDETTRPVLFLIDNGSFESGDLSGWGDSTATGSAAGVYVFDGTTGPASNNAVPTAPHGTYWVLFDQTGPSTHFLYQDVSIPAGYTATLDATIHLNNQAGDYYIAPTDGLAYESLDANQHFRIDVVSTSADLHSVGAGVLQSIYRTDPGDALVDDLVVTADLSAFAGQTVRLRFALVNNQIFFLVGIDAVEITAE